MDNGAGRTALESNQTALKAIDTLLGGNRSSRNSAASSRDSSYQNGDSSDEEVEYSEGGLRNGDVVVFTANGLPYAARGVSSDKSDPAKDTYEFSLTAVAEGYSIADAATHLVVLRQGRWLGFRSASANGKLLQARKRGNTRLCFFNHNFGVFEQWETDDEPIEDGWSSALLRLKNRRSPGFVLTVEVMKVPSNMQYGDDVDLPVLGASESPRCHSEVVIRAPGSASSVRYGRSDDTDTTNEQGNIMKSMSGLLVKEWSAFVVKEVSERKQMEQNLQLALDEVESLKVEMATEVNRLAAEWHDNTAEISEIMSIRQKHARELRINQIFKIMNMLRCQRLTKTSFYKWRNDVIRSQQYNSLVDRYNLRLMTQHMGQWARGSVELKRLKQLETRARLRYIQRMQAKVMQRWVSQVRQTEFETRLLARSNAKLVRQTMYRTLKEWYSVACDLRSLQKSVLGIEAEGLRKRLIAILHAWMGWWKDKKEKARLNRRYKMRLYRAVVFAWYEEVQFLKSKRARAAKLCKEIFGKRTRAYIASWFRYSRIKQAVRLHMIRSQFFLSKAKLRRLLNTWVGSIRGNHLLQTKLSKCVVRWQANQHQSTFRVWREHAQILKTQRKLAQKVMARMTHHRLGGFFASWGERAATLKEARRVTTYVIRRIKNLQMGSTFLKWAEDTRRNKGHRILLTRIAIRMSRRCLVKAWDQWLDVTRSSKQGTASLNTKILHMQQETMYSVFEKWYEWTTEEVNTRNTLVRTRERLLRLFLGQTFILWWSEIAYTKSQKRKLLMVVSRMTRVLLWYAVSGWRDISAKMKNRRHRLRRVLKRWTNRYAHDALVAWSNVTNRVRYLRMIGLRVVSKLHNGIQSEAFRSWATCLEVSKLQARDIEKHHLRRITQYLTKSFLSWTLFVRDQQRERYVAKSSNQHLFRKVVPKAMEQWYRRVKRVKFLKRKLDLLLSRSKPRMMRNTFLGWADIAIHRSTRARVVARVRKMWNTRLAIAAINQWTEVAASSGVVAKKMAKLMKSSLGRTLRNVFNAWQEAADTWELRSGRVGRMMKLMAKQKSDMWMQKLLSEWRIFVINEDRRRGREKTITEWLQKLQVRRLFSQWTNTVRVNKVMRATALKVVKRMQQFVLQEAFTTMFIAAKDLKKKRSQLTRAVGMFKRRSAGLYFFSWFKHVKLVKNHNRITSILVPRTNLRLMAEMWGMWAQCAIRVKGMPTRRKIFARNMARFCVTAAFRGWRDLKATEETRMRQCRRAWRKLNKRKLINTILTWREYSLAQKVLKQRAKRAAAHMTVVVLRGVLHAWHANAQYARGIKTVGVKGLARWTNMMKATALSQWINRHSELKRDRALIMKVANRIKNVTLVRTFNTWKEGWMTYRWNALRATAVHKVVLARLLRANVANAFSTWALHMSRIAAHKLKTSKIQGLTNFNLVSGAFNTWCEFVDAINARRELIGRCVTKKRVSLAFFLQWYWEAYAGDIRGALELLGFSCDEAMGEIFQAPRQLTDGAGGAANGMSIFREWQLLGTSMEALKSATPTVRRQPIFGAAGGAPVDESKAKWGEVVRSLKPMLESNKKNGIKTGSSDDDDDESDSAPIPSTILSGGERRRAQTMQGSDRYSGVRASAPVINVTKTVELAIDDSSSSDDDVGPERSITSRNTRIVGKQQPRSRTSTMF